MKTPQEILAKKNITELTKHHSYDYLYKTIIKTCEEYADQFKKIEVEHNVTPNSELFVPFDIAATMKIKGFDEICYGIYEYSKDEIKFSDKNYQIRNSNIDSNTHFAAPTYQQVVDWLETKKIYFSKYRYDDTITPARWAYSLTVSTKDWTDVRHSERNQYLGSDFWVAIRRTIDFLDKR